MTRDQCGHLDDYLDGVLDAAAADRFVEHLPRCAACRDAVQFEQNLAAVVQAANREIAPPVSLVTQTRQTIGRWRRRRRLTWAAGVALTLIVGVSFAFQRREPEAVPEQRQIVQEAPPQPPAVPESPPAETQTPDDAQEPAPPEKAIVLAGPAGQPRHIAVPQPTENDNVTFVMLMPTIDRQKTQAAPTPPARPDDTPFRKGTYQ